MATIGRHVTLEAQPEAALGLFRCASPGIKREVFKEAGFRDVSEEQASRLLVDDFLVSGRLPSRYEPGSYG